MKVREKTWWNRAGNRKPVTVLAIMLALILAIGAPAVSGRALALDLDADCSVTVKLGVDDAAFEEDIATAGVLVDVYKVAEALPVSGYETYEWAYLDAYKDAAPEDMSSENAESFAQAAAAIALKDDSIQPLASGAMETAVSLAHAAGGGAGMYLVIPHGSLEEYVVEEEGVITTIAQSTGYEYSFTPQIISLPTKEDLDGSGEITTAWSDGEWIYDAELKLKVGRVERFGPLKITKVLDHIEAREGDIREATFVFKIVATKDGKTVYSNVESMRFNAAGTDSITIENKIPVGAEVVVTEVYAGAAYEIVGDASATTTIVNATDGGAVDFENDYNHEDHGGGSVKNTFTFTKDDGEWDWSNDLGGGSGQAAGE